MGDVTIASWNLHQGVDRSPSNMKRTWDFLENDLAPTVALLQEAVVPDALTGVVAPNRETLPYGTAVLAYGASVTEIPPVRARYIGAELAPVSPRVESTLALGIVQSDSFAPFVAISMYGRIQGGYAQTNVLRAVADLIPCSITANTGSGSCSPAISTCTTKPAIWS